VWPRLDQHRQPAITFLALWVAGLLMRHSARFSCGFVVLTFVLAALLVIVCLGRLIVLTPSSPLVLVPAAVTGFIVNPIWYLWLSRQLQGAGRIPVDLPCVQVATDVR
jgi:hypothetical protein